MQNRRHGRQTGGTGEPFRIVTDEPVDGECELVGGDLGLGANPPILNHFRMVTDTRDQTDHGVGVADVDGEQHLQPTTRGDSSPSASSGIRAASSPTSIWRLSPSTNTTLGRNLRASASSRVA